MTSEAYQRIFPRTTITGRNTDTEQRFGQNGFRLATSIDGTLTGRGADFLIIDDPHNASAVVSQAERDRVNRWFPESLISRLNNHGDGVIIIVMQRLHPDDLVGHLTAEDGHGWTVLNIPAIAEQEEVYRISNIRGRTTHTRHAGEVIDPRRMTREQLEDIRAMMGSIPFAAQFQQSPISDAGNIIRRDWFQYYRLPFTPPPGSLIVQSWDVAMVAGPRNDYSVCTTWAVHDRRFYLLDVYRQRVEYPELLRAALGLVRRYQPNEVLIEEANTGIALRQDLRNVFMRERIAPSIKGITPTGDKTQRLVGVSAFPEQRRVYLPENALFVDEFLRELVSFPSRHDDQVDSFSQFFAWYRSLKFFPMSASGRPIITPEMRMRARRRR